MWKVDGLTDGKTNMVKLLVAFSSFAKARTMGLENQDITMWTEGIEQHRKGTL